MMGMMEMRVSWKFRFKFELRWEVGIGTRQQGVETAKAVEPTNLIHHSNPLIRPNTFNTLITKSLQTEKRHKKSKPKNKTSPLQSS